MISTICWDHQEMTEFRDELLKAGADPSACSNDKVSSAMRACWHVLTTMLRQIGRRRGRFERL